MNRVLQVLFFALIVRPIVLVIIGLNIRNRDRLPAAGPAILVANHNSHLDTLVLMSLFPLRQIHKVRPVAAADYFLNNRLLGWFALNILGIIPVSRATTGGNPLAGSIEALEKGQILILYPEGSRGEPEKLADEFKRGVQLIARKSPHTSVIPVFLHGLGKALPKGEAILVPFFCDVFIGNSMTYDQTKTGFVEEMKNRIMALSQQAPTAAWE